MFTGSTDGSDGIRAGTGPAAVEIGFAAVPLKLGLNLGYWGIGPEGAEARGGRAGGRGRRVRLRLGGRGLWLRHRQRPRLAGAADDDDQSRRRGDAGAGEAAGRRGDGRGDDRQAHRRALHLRLRTLRAAGFGGLVRGSLREALGPDPRVRRDRARDHRPRGPPGASWPALRPAPPRRRGQGAEARLPPGAGPDSRLPRGDRPQLGRDHGRDRRRLDSRLLQCRATSRRSGASTSRPASRREVASAQTSRSRRPCRSRSTGTPTPRVSVVKAGLLLYLGGMGSRKTNFYVDLTHRYGFGEVADEVQRLYQDGDREAAYAAISDDLVHATSLIGSESEVAAQAGRFRSCRSRPADRLAGPSRPGRAPAHDRAPRRDGRSHRPRPMSRIVVGSRRS